MRTSTPPETVRVAALSLLALLALPCGAAAAGDERWLVGGLFDAELWETDDGSVLLSKNEGDGAAAGTLRLWTATEPLRRLQLVAMGEFHGGSAYEESEQQLEQAYVRYTFGGDKRMFVEGGKIVTPLGDFPPRHLSSVNPLIGSPTTYDVDYPIGVQWAGSVSLLDFRAAVVDAPLANAGYLPTGDGALRPALALGLTPLTGLRIGAYHTSGPYLDSDLDLGDPDANWRDFTQQVTGVDLQFSRGHFELHADYNGSSYEVPGYDTPLHGSVLFVEPRYTWSARWFTALRLETNDYVYAAPPDGDYGWYATVTRVDDVEVGTGYRIGADTVLKLSYRFDRWHVDEEQSAYLPEGHAFALQLSQQFDVRDWFDRASR